jgi:S-formylglutathione hydrolase FrmB
MIRKDSDQEVLNNKSGFIMRTSFLTALFYSSFFSAAVSAVAEKFPTRPYRATENFAVSSVTSSNRVAENETRHSAHSPGRCVPDTLPDNNGPDIPPAIADTITIRSSVMNKDIRCVVIRPETTDSLPVLYLLHGWSGNYSNWISKVPELKEWAAAYRMMIVCPDGAYSSWYFDSPVEPGSKYETYIGIEVPAFIDSHYAIKRGRTARAITGLSMGGHGALFIAFRHASGFGAAGSMSGGLDLTVLKNKYDISRRLGDTTKFAENYRDYSVLNVIEKKPSDSLAIIFDCGTSDAFYAMNVAVHQKMRRLGIAHDYTERPGGHDWQYWKNSLKYQLVFFHDYFITADK